MLHIPALGSSFLFPEAVRQLLYLLFRRHGYLPNEELMREDQFLSSFCGIFQSHFRAGTEPSAQRRPKVVLMVNRRGSSASGGYARLMGQ
jgi:hypothetical protein